MQGLKMEVLYFLVFGFVCFTEGQYTTHVIPMSVEPSRVFVEENETVIMTCDLVPEGKPLRWNHNQELIAVISEGNNIHYINAARDNATYMLVAPATPGGNYTMTINKFLPTHSGTVTCSVSETPPLQARLQLIKPPDRIQVTRTNSGWVIPRFRENFLIRAESSDWLNLTCSSVNSKPQPVVKWRWNDTNEIFGEWDSVISTLSTVTGAFNGSSMLYLPPNFSAILLESLVTINMTTQTASVSSTAETFTASTSSNPANTSSIATNTTMAPPVVDHVIKITCSTMVGDRRYERSVLVHIRNEWNKAGTNKGHYDVIFALLIVSWNFI